MKNINKKEKVSVFCLTYNHADYIRDCLEGILMQKTTFPIEICIYDDASTDGTSEIVREYQSKYPKQIKSFISEKNMFSQTDDFTRYLRMALRSLLDGELIAICEGDDYWTYENKLQIQYDYMMNNKECVLSAHASKWLDCRDNSVMEYRPYDCEIDLSAEDVIYHKNGDLTTASFMVRKECFFLDEAFPKCEVGDYPLELYALLKGKIHYFNKIMCTYRYSRPESWGTMLTGKRIRYCKHSLSMAAFLDEYDKYSKRAFHEYVIRKKHNYMLSVNVVYDELLSEEIEELSALSSAETWKDIVRLHDSLLGMIRLSETDKRKLIDSKYIVIYGCGNNAEMTEKLILDMGRSIDGYVISDDQENNCRQHNGKTVWKLSEYPYDPGDTTIAVSAWQKYESEIRDELMKYEGYKLITPLWYRFD